MSSYFIYKISQVPGNIIKSLEKINHYDSYKEAKQEVRSLRNNQESAESTQYKIIFAKSELDAEEQLQVKREAPILQEWEK